MSFLTTSPNLGPLTTRFTPPSTCYATITSGGAGDSGLGQTYAYANSFDAIDPSCYPTNYATDDVYSPGICPSGMTSACSPEKAGYSAPYPSSITAVQCCPCGMVCATSGGSDFYAWCTSVTSEGTATILAYTNTTESSVCTTDLSSAIKVYFKPIFVAYESTDTEILSLLAATTSSSSSVVTTLQSSSSQTASPGSTVTKSAAAVTTTPASSTTSASSTSAGSGLSEGAKVGIGVGTTLGVLILLGLIVLILRTRKKTPNGQDAGFKSSKSAFFKRRNEPPAEPFNQSNPSMQVQEVIHELPAGKHHTELDGASRIGELA